MPIPKKLLTSLDKAKATYEVVKHKTVFTAYDLAQTTKRKLQEIAKTLLVKADGKHVLVVLPAHLRLDLVKLKKLLGAKKVQISTEKDMAKSLKVKPGAITPFGSLHQLEVVVDKSLAKVQKAIFGAGSFTESLRMKVKDFLKLENPKSGNIGKKG